VAAEISTLGEGLHALGACEWALACVLAEVVSQVAALFEDGAAVRVAAFEIKLNSHCFRVTHFDSLMPRSRNTLEGFGLLPGGAPQLGNLAALS